MIVTISDEVGLSSDLQGNSFIGQAPDMENARIVFKGEGNVLYCEPGVNLSGVITFNGNNGLVVLGKNGHPYKLNLTINNNCTAAFDRDIYFNGTLNVILSEERSLLIGEGCLLSFGIWIRTADPHLIYDAETSRRINPSRDIVIGDHVWIGQSAMVLKGSMIGSGSIIGGMSVVAGKSINSNSSWAGNPVRKLRDGIFWDGACVHTWSRDQTKRSERYAKAPHVFHEDSTTVDLREFCGSLHGLYADKRLQMILDHGLDGRKKNRFYVPPAKVQKTLATRLCRKLKRRLQ